MKYSLPDGSVVDIDIDDVLSIDFETIDGKQNLQEIIAFKFHANRYFEDFDSAIENDELKFFDEIKELNIDEEIIIEIEEINSLEDFEDQLYRDSLSESTES